MKYLIMMELERPYEDNMRRVFEIDNERKSKGMAFGDAIVFPEHSFLSEENKRFMIVETDDLEKIAKWEIDYLTVLKFKVIPIIESTKMNELVKERWSHVMQ